MLGLMDWCENKLLLLNYLIKLLISNNKFLHAEFIDSDAAVWFIEGAGELFVECCGALSWVLL